VITNGFSIGTNARPDIYEHGIGAFVDGGVPMLRERSLFHGDYDAETLRGHLGVAEQ
jgi:hypothetical protein